VIFKSQKKIREFKHFLKIMRVRTEGVFKMHSEDDDFNLPIAFQQRRHEQKIEGLLADLMKNWRLKERVRCTVGSIDITLNLKFCSR
jgi:hypothetical protein